MIPVLIIVGLFVVYELMTSQNTLSVPTAAGAVAPPSARAAVATDNGPSAGEAGAVSGISAGLNFVPIAGPVLSAAFSVIAGSLMKASAQRAAQAKNENSAVAAAVPGWDAGLAQVVAAFNAGQITAAEFQSFIMTPGSNPSGQGVLWTNFWNEVTPQIQPGRNGCKGGTVQQNKSGPSYCGPAGLSYGASCCVGYDDLDNSSINVMNTLNKGGGTANILAVFASKYGGANRPAYTVTIKPPAPVTTVTGQAESILQEIGL
jgi:hypothetical protein